MLRRKPSYELTLDEYREIMNLPNHVIAIIKSDGTFYKVNEVASPVLGWEPEEAVGKSVQEFTHPDDWDRSLATMAGALLGSTPIVKDFVTRAKHKDGSWRWISWTGKAKGGMLYCHGTDVTEKVEYEEALSVQSLVLESISEAVTITNSKGTIVFANSASERLFGYDTEELLGKNFLILSDYPEDYSQMYLQDALGYIEKKKMWEGEWQNRRRDGSSLITACRVTPLDLNGEVHYVCVQRDITQKKKYTHAWQELQLRFRTFFEQSILPMEIYDLEGNPLEVNQAWENLFETNKDSIKGYNILTDPTSETMGILDYVKRAYAGEAVEVPPFRVDPAEMGRTGRARWLTAWFSPVKDELGEVRELAMILKDVTEERETQEALAYSNALRMNMEERLSLAVKAGKIGIWEWSPISNKVLWDETTEQIYGYEKGTFAGTADAYLQHIVDEQRETIWKTINEAIENHRPYSFDHRICRKDGVYRWIQGSGMAFYDHKGKPYRLMGTVQDITDRKKAEDDQTFPANISEILSSSLDFKENLQRFVDAASVYFCDGAYIDQLNPEGQIERIIVTHPDPEKKEALSIRHAKALEDYDDFHPLLSSIVSGKTVYLSQIGKNRQELTTLYGDDFANEALSATMSSTITIRLRGRETLLGTVTFFIIDGSK
jgi:PAS domain S-box-containing protein